MTLEEGTLLYGEAVKTDSDKPYYVGIFFDYIQDETSTVEASITDNYVESNYSLQDHIAIKPRIYRLRGCVGEVLFVNSFKFIDKYEEFKRVHPVFQKTVDAINGVGALSGIVSNFTQTALNITKQIESSYDRYQQILNNFRNQSPLYRGKRQKVCYDILSYMLRNRVAVSIKNLAFDSEEFVENYPKLYFIQSVSAHQGDNAYITDIEVTIKEFRIATTQTTEIDTTNFAGNATSQTTQEANNGIAKGDTVPKEVQQNTFTTGVKAGLAQPFNQIKKFAIGIKDAYNKTEKALMGSYYKK